MSKELLGSLELNRIYQMDCRDLMKLVPEKSISLIIEDRPYGKLPTNKVKWDSSWKIEGLFKEYNRILQDEGQIVIWGQQPMLSFVLIEALENDFEYRFEEIWEKPSAMWSSNYIPLKVHEQFLVLKKKRSKTSDLIFNLDKLKTDGESYIRDGTNDKTSSTIHNINSINTITENDGKRFPRSVIKAASKQYMKKEDRTNHPTQKPLEICDWIIKGMSNDESIIYIPFCGSGSEVVSAKKFNRTFLASETESKYIELANKRLESTYSIETDNKLLDIDDETE